MSAGHTPGPWRVGSAANGNWIEAGHASQSVSLGRTFYNDVGSDAEDANARVMAAAPDLLEVATTFIAALEGAHVDYDVLASMARAAIAKAIGK